MRKIWKWLGGAGILLFLAGCSTSDTPSEITESPPTEPNDATSTLPAVAPATAPPTNSPGNEDAGNDGGNAQQLPVQHQELYDQYEIITLLPKDGIPAIDNPTFLSAEEADSFYDPDELVMGVEFGSEARAYSVPFLSRHEIVNDTVSGVKIAVTW